MPTLNQSRQDTLLLVGLLFAQLLLMAVSSRGSSGTNLLELGTMRVTRPIVTAAETVGGSIRGAVIAAAELIGAKADNERLRGEVQRLREEANRLREKAQENERLKDLLDMRQALAPRSVGASIIQGTLTGQTKMVVIDRGIIDGVHADLPVIAWGGAVGRVITAGRNVAKVQLISDPNSSVAGVVQRSRAQGQVYGQGDRPLTLEYVPVFSDVSMGDRVVTSGLGGIFPRGVTIGTVSFIGEDSKVSKTIELIPAVDFDRLEEVVVLLEPAATDVLDHVGFGDQP